MTLQASGPISLSDIAGEFNVSPPYKLSDFYRGGANVPDITENASIPTSGQINLADFYGASNYPTIVSATLTQDVDVASCGGGGACNPGGSSASLSPSVVDGDPTTRTYVWTRHSGDVPDSGFPNGASIFYSVSGQSLEEFQSVSKSGTFSVEVTDSTGTVTSNTVVMSARIQNDGGS